MKHSPLDTLRRLHKEAALQFPTQSEWDSGLGAVGLKLSNRLENGGYVSTPTNSLQFAYTGGEGVHFSFLSDVPITHDTPPVIVTIPAAFGSENFVLGENLSDFLCLGMHRGYFALEQLGYNYDETVAVYSDPAWQPKTTHHDWVGYRVDDRKRAILAFLSQKLALVPWGNVKEKLAMLTTRYRGLLRMSEEYLRLHA